MISPLPHRRSHTLLREISACCSEISACCSDLLLQASSGPDRKKRRDDWLALKAGIIQSAVTKTEKKGKKYVKPEYMESIDSK